MAPRSGFATMLAERLSPTPNPYRDDPAAWVRDVLRKQPWSAQVEIMESVRDNRRTAVPSAMGLGKSWDAAALTLWWIDTRTPGKARVVTTGPSDPAVKTGIWYELPQLHAEAGLPGRIGLDAKWTLPIGATQLVVAEGRKPADPAAGTEPSMAAANFRGRHAPEGVLVICDEVSGVGDWLIDTLGDVATEAASRILVIGNPDYEGSKFWQISQPGGLYNVIHLDALESPNFTEERVAPELAAALPDQTRVDEVIAEFGEDSPAYLIKVRGMFPADASDGVIPRSWVVQCQGVEATNRIGPLREPVELGVDVGGSAGGDFTVITGREGMRAMPSRPDWRLRVDALDSARIGRKVLEVIAEVRATAVKIDAPGVGYGVIGYVEEGVRQRVNGIYWPVRVVPVNVGSVSYMTDQTGRPRFDKIKAEIWWEVGRELSRHRKWDLTDVDEQTVNQLTDVRWSLDERGGLIQIEGKDDVKKRTRRSPDDADALLLAFYEPKPKGGVVQAARVVDRRHAGRR